jgi:hypothetical protein
VYSFALTGLEMLGGEHPAGLNTTGDDREAARAVKRLLARRPEVPMRLAAVLRRALRLDPAMRFADADAFLDALEEWDHAPPRDAASAAGYASILPSAPRAFAAAGDDATVIAPPAVPDGTMAAPGSAPPFAFPQAAPVPAAAQVQAPAAPAATDDAQPKPRRRLRLRPAGWFVLLLLVLLVAAYAMWPSPRRSHSDDGRTRPTVETPQAPVEPAGGPGLARDEWDRVTASGSFGPGDTLYVVIVGSFTPDQMDVARRIRASARRQGYSTGMANSEVYRELRDGWVAVVAGPYPTRDGAEDVLPALRRDVMPDAFLKRVTLRRP